MMPSRWSIKDTMLTVAAIFFAAPLAAFADDLSTQLRPG